MVATMQNQVESEVRRYSRYLRYLADSMQLHAWKLQLVLDPTLDDSLASVQITTNRQLAVIRIGELFLDSDGSDQRHALVHELVHCHLDGVRATAETAKSPMGDSTFTVWRQNHDNALESSVDRLAAALAAPLWTPEQWEERKAPCS